MVWVGSNLQRSSTPTPLPWAGTSFTRSGCSNSHPTWPWTLPMTGHPILLKETKFTLFPWKKALFCLRDFFFSHWVQILRPAMNPLGRGLLRNTGKRQVAPNTCKHRETSQIQEVDCEDPQLDDVSSISGPVFSQHAEDAFHLQTHPGASTDHCWPQCRWATAQLSGHLILISSLTP